MNATRSPDADLLAAYAQCEREPLHRSGAIQPHGALVVVDRIGRVTHTSDNAVALLAESAHCTRGQPLPAALAAHWADLGRAAGDRLVRLACVEGRLGALDLSASRGEHDLALLELVAHRDWAPPANRRALALAPAPADEAELRAQQQALVEAVAALTGFQRVMYYAFRDDGDGEVLAEARQPHAYGSYLGLRFPAHDIPQIARQLYLRNPWRLIPDARAEPAAVHGVDAEPPDLTWSDLRSVSPVHRVYLSNMGVRASLSFPVTVSGQLVALIAAHHREPSQVPLAACEHAAAMVRAHAMALTSHQAQRRMRLVDGMQRRFDDVQAIVQRCGSVSDAFALFAPQLLGTFDADGVHLLDGDTRQAYGATLEPGPLEALDAWFCEHARDALVWTGDSLSRQVPAFGLSHCAGALALRVARAGDRGLRLFLTRGESVHEVSWGGQPQLPEERHDGTLGIAPRLSFERWIEKRLGYSRAWDNESKLLALRLRDVLRAGLPA